MPTSHLFDGKVHKLPGIYAVTKSLIEAPNITAAYSKVLIIDTGLRGEIFGRGAGVVTDTKGLGGKNSIYHFTSPSDMKDFVQAGYWYILADALFNPSNVPGTPGASDVYFISACSTKPASAIFNVRQPRAAEIGTGTADNPEKPAVPGIDFVIKCRHEGRFGNSWGDLTDPSTETTTKDVGKFQEAGSQNSVVTDLRMGYAIQFFNNTGDSDNPFGLRFFNGTYRGVYQGDNKGYTDTALSDAKPRNMFSLVFSSFWDLHEKMKKDPNFNGYFRLDSNYDDPDFNNLNDQEIFDGLPKSMIAFFGGDETFDNDSHIETVIEATKGIDSNFVITDRNGVEHGADLINERIMFSVLDQRFEQWLVVGGGNNEDEFDKKLFPGSLSSVDMAKEFDSDRVWVVHSGVNKGITMREWDSLYTACYVVGRIAGTPPQVPATFKEINISGLVHDPTDREKIKALDSGVLMIYYDDDFQRFCILKGINTLQNNEQMVNPDGTTHLIQLRRCAAQINKELIQDAKRELFSQREGVTVMSLPAAQVETWVSAKLSNKIDRHLLVSFVNIVVERRGDAYFVSYGFIPNYEINFIFFTSFILE